MIRIALVVLAFVLASSTEARNFRWATQGDATSLDPHAQNENLTHQVNAMVYEQLLQYDRHMRLVPCGRSAPFLLGAGR